MATGARFALAKFDQLRGVERSGTPSSHYETVEDTESRSKGSGKPRRKSDASARKKSKSKPRPERSRTESATLDAETQQWLTGEKNSGRSTKSSDADGLE